MGRNSLRTPFLPRLHLGSGTEKTYKKISEYNDGLSILIGNCKVRMILLFKDLKIRLQVFSKKSSNFAQKTQPAFAVKKATNLRLLPNHEGIIVSFLHHCFIKLNVHKFPIIAFSVPSYKQIYWL